jgi:1,2-phenylacetyl-CoA epoxidase catalytic subunit
MPEAVSPQEFVHEMEATLRQVLAVRDVALSGIEGAVGRADMRTLLHGALRAEFEASQIAALWMPTTPELEAKIALARQAGDEARHFMLIEGRLKDLGEGPDGEPALAMGPSPLYRYMETLETTVERVAAAQFTREAIGYKSNELFIAFCEAAGDRITAQMYRESIQPDEKHHHEWGKRLLAHLAVDASRQEAARRAILRTLELAEELRSLAAGRLLVETLPGC